MTAEELTQIALDAANEHMPPNVEFSGDRITALLRGVAEAIIEYGESGCTRCECSQLEEIREPSYGGGR